MFSFIFTGILAGAGEKSANSNISNFKHDPPQSQSFLMQRAQFAHPK
jgi:hypothetical protein